MTDGYPSHGRAHLADLQRKRRARMVRIDYMPSADALAIIEAKRGRYYPLNTNSGIIDAILSEWVVLIGIKRDEVSKPKRPEFRQQAQARMTFDAARSARAQESGNMPGIITRIAGVRAGAYESGSPENRAKQARRVVCGAKRHRDGQPCEAKSEPGKRRCRFHGGRSTGPRTPEGKARAVANLRQYRKV